MRLDDFDPNINVEDQRGSGGGFGGFGGGGGGGGLLLAFLPMVFSRFGCFGVAVLAGIFFLFSGGLQMVGGGAPVGGSGAPAERRAGTDAASSCTIDAASKAALDNMTRSFARKLAPEIKVNAIAPSLIMFNEGDDEAYRQQALDKSLMKIAPGEKEISDLIDYLFTSRYVTGRSYAVDGGRPLR